MAAILIGYTAAIAIIFPASRPFSINRHVSGRWSEKWHKPINSRGCRFFCCWAISRLPLRQPSLSPLFGSSRNARQATPATWLFAGLTSRSSYRRSSSPYQHAHEIRSVHLDPSAIRSRELLHGLPLDSRMDCGCASRRPYRCRQYQRTRSPLKTPRLSRHRRPP
jgi:hypothetical protein